MPKRRNAFVLNTTTASHSPLMIGIDVAHRNGFDGIETTVAKVRDYLGVGHTVAELEAALDGLPIYGIGSVIDVERHGAETRSLIEDAKQTFTLAREIGAAAVTLINGPLDFREAERCKRGEPRQGYRGVLEYQPEEQFAITAANLRLLSHIAEDFGVIVYLEALAWSPIRTIQQQLTLLRKVDHENLKVVVDFWHCFASGDRPEDVAKIDRHYIYGVHVCDSLPIDSSLVPDEMVLRDVVTGRGVIDLKAWTDAVKSTGYCDWWCSETFCKKTHQENSYDVASAMKAQLTDLVERRDATAEVGL